MITLHECALYNIPYIYKKWKNNLPKQLSLVDTMLGNHYNIQNIELK